MRTTLALAAVLLLVGAGCAPEKDRDDVKFDDTQVPYVTDATAEVTTATTTSATVTTTPATTTIKVEKIEDRNDEDRDDEDENDDVVEVKKVTTPTTTPTATAPAKPVTTGPKTFTMAEVKAKADAGACWTVI